MSKTRIAMHRIAPFLAAALLLYLPAPLAVWLHLPDGMLSTITVWLLELIGLSFLVVAFVRRRGVLTAIAIVLTVLYLAALLVVASVMNDRYWFSWLPIETTLLAGFIVAGAWHVPISWIALAAYWDAFVMLRGQPQPTESQLTRASS